MSFEVSLLIKSTLILASAALANAMLRRGSAATRHAIWTMAFLCLLSLPVVCLYLPESLQVQLAVLPEARVVPEPSASYLEQASVPARTPADASVWRNSEPLQPSSTPAPGSPKTWILFAWAVGVVVALLRTVLAIMAVRSISARSISAPDVEWTSILALLQQELGIGWPVDLRIGGDLPPMTWGWRRPVILLPSSAHSWTQERRRAVLTHELAHIKRRDGLTQILVELACTAYWLSPLVWIAERRMRLERERACDDYVLNVGLGAAPYAGHLLEIATGSSSGAFLPTVSMAQPSQLEVRLRAILNSNLRRGRLSRSTVALLVSSILIVVVTLASVHVTTLLSMTLPMAAVPGVPVIQTPNAPQAPQPPSAPPVLPVLRDLAANQQEPATNLEVTVSTIGIAGIAAPEAFAGTIPPQSTTATSRTAALVVVLDRSGSMGASLEFAKEGAKRAVSLLREKDLFGVLTSDYNFQWIVEIAEARNREKMQEAINRIYAAGNTNIYPGLKEAFSRLQATTADAKHILLVSDGITPAANFQDLVSQMSSKGITVSTVALGVASNRALLADIAIWGRGRAYSISNVSRLPQVFEEEVSRLIGQ
jgi:beta-lactamase regulating signal transducer with metallopeptidase domain